MKLNEWIIRRWPDLSDAARNVAMANLIGCTATTIWRYRHGARTPNNDAIRAIVRATNGEVSANDLLSLDECGASAT